MTRSSSGTKKAASLFEQDQLADARELRCRLDPDDKLTREELWVLIVRAQFRADLATAVRSDLEVRLADAEGRAERAENQVAIRRMLVEVNKVVRKAQGERHGKKGGRPKTARTAVAAAKKLGRPRKADDGSVAVSDRLLRRRKARPKG